jgi:hypothetical protein
MSSIGQTVSSSSVSDIEKPPTGQLVESSWVGSGTCGVGSNSATSTKSGGCGVCDMDDVFIVSDLNGLCGVCGVSNVIATTRKRVRTVVVPVSSHEVSKKPRQSGRLKERASAVGAISMATPPAIPRGTKLKPKQTRKRPTVDMFDLLTDGDQPKSPLPETRPDATIGFSSVADMEPTEHTWRAPEHPWLTPVHVPQRFLSDDVGIPALSTNLSRLPDWSVGDNPAPLMDMNCYGDMSSEPRFNWRDLDMVIVDPSVPLTALDSVELDLSVTFPPSPSGSVVRFLR